MSVPTYTSTVDINTFKAPFLATYEGAVSGLWVNDVAFTSSISGMTGVYTGLASTSAMTAWTGSRTLQNPLPFKTTLTSAAYESSVKYPVDNFNADGIGVFANNINDLANKAAWHRQNLLVTLLAAGTSTASYDSLYDGSTAVNYFSTGHKYGFDATGASPTGTQKNLLTSSEVASLDVATVAAPTVSECSSIVNDLTTYMLGMRDLAGDPINGNARSFVIVVGDGPKFTSFLSAISLINIQVSNAYGATSITNPVAGFQSNGFKYKVVYEPALTGAAIYFLRADGYTKPFVIQETQGITTQAMGPDSEYAKLNNNVIFGAKEVVAVGPLLYQSALKATLS